MEFPSAYPHGAIEPFGQDLFMVRGSIDFNRFVRLSRNMAIVRSGSELTLVNPIRLDEKGLHDLDALGTVRHLVRLGSFHGSDDPFYAARYRPTFWSQPGGKRYKSPSIDRVLAEGGELPLAGARLLTFSASLHPESVLVLERGAGVLLACDALQNYGDYSNLNWAARLLMPVLGFSKTTLIGPLWLKAATPPGGSLRTDFERLLALKFDALLAAHGTLLKTGAHAAVARAIARAFAS
jgi:hypothetical protein